MNNDENKNEKKGSARKHKLNFEKFNNVSFSTNSLILLDLRKTLIQNGLSIPFFFNHIIEKIAAKDERYLFILTEASEAFKSNNSELMLGNSIEVNSSNEEDVKKLTEMFGSKSRKSKNNQHITETIYSLIEKELASTHKTEETK